jgi:tetratricopeptide (TPR) repeat protein
MQPSGHKYRQPNIKSIFFNLYFLMDRIAKLKEFLARDPGDLFSAHALALELVKAGDDDGAKALFEDILARDPAYTGSYYHLGRLLERAGRIEEARLVYASGITMARSRNETLAANELRSALEELD